MRPVVAAFADEHRGERHTFGVCRSGTVILDVRTHEEFATGHLAGARNIDVGSPDFTETVAALPKDGTYALYCRSGNRSGQALSAMTQLGFTRVYHLAGGISAWESAGQPVTTD
ncbi:MAG: rhodanese-like domain-containing protein [Tetrasphaera sp.]